MAALPASKDKDKKPRCSSLLEKAGLSKVMQELADLPEEQQLHVFLPDICRSRYDVPDIKGHILPLLKPLLTGQPRTQPSSDLFTRNFRDDELRTAFTIQPGPAPLPVKDEGVENDELAKARRIKMVADNGKKRSREGAENGSKGPSPQKDSKKAKTS